MVTRSRQSHREAVNATGHVGGAMAREDVFYERDGAKASLVFPERTGEWERGGRVPLVVLMHGISAHSRQKLIRDIAATYEQLGLPVMRLNMPEDKQTIPISKKAEFLTAALQEALKDRRIDPGRVVLVGHSQGGLVIRRGFDQIGKLARNPFVITVSSPPHLKMFNESLQNITPVLYNANLVNETGLFSDASDIGKMKISDEEAQRDFLTPKTKQLHVIHAGDTVCPLEWYLQGHYAPKKRQLKILPSLMTVTKRWAAVRRLAETMKSALDEAGVDSERFARSIYVYHCAGDFAKQLKDAIRNSGATEEKINSALRKISTAEGMSNRLMKSQETHRRVGFLRAVGLLQMGDTHNWTDEADQKLLLETLRGAVVRHLKQRSA